MLYDVHITELIPKQSYELRVDRFVYPLSFKQLLDLHNSLTQLLNKEDSRGNLNESEQRV